MIFDVTPVAKPRMTRRDVWKQRPSVMKYRQYCDDLRAEAEKKNYKIGNQIGLIFYMPMPDSWSIKKKAKYVGTPHKQRPDDDNLIKAYCDALAEEDSDIWNKHAIKVWSYTGKIEVRFNIKDKEEIKEINPHVLMPER